MSALVLPAKPVEGTNTEPSESIYRLIIVAGLRSKQLLRGSKPRVAADNLRRKNTSIALEEVRLGLVKYTVREPKAVPSTVMPLPDRPFASAPLVGKALV